MKKNSVVGKTGETYKGFEQPRGIKGRSREAERHAMPACPCEAPPRELPESKLSITEKSAARSSRSCSVGMAKLNVFAHCFGFNSFEWLKWSLIMVKDLKVFLVKVVVNEIYPTYETPT